MNYQYLIRLATDGGNGVKATLASIGDTGATAFQKLDRSIDISNTTLDKFSKIARRSVVALGASAVATGYLVKRQMDQIDSNAKVAQSFDVTYQALIDNALVAKEAGISIDDLGKIWDELNLKITDGSAKDAVQALGLSIKDLAKETPDQQFADIAAAISKIDSASARASYSVELFGKAQGRKLLPLIESYNSKIQEASAFNEKFGVSLSDIDVAKIEQANDAVGRIGQATEGVTNTLAVKTAPAVQAVAEAFLNMGYNQETFGNAVDATLNATARVGDMLLQIFRTLEVSYKSLEYGFANMLKLYNDFIAKNVDWATNGIFGEGKGTNLAFNDTAINKNIEDRRKAALAAIDGLDAGWSGDTSLRVQLENARKKSQSQATETATAQSLLRNTGRGGTSNAFTDTMQKERDKIAEVVAQLKFRNEQMTRTNEEQELYNQLQKAGVSLNSEAGQKIKQLVDDYNEYTKAQERNKEITEALHKSADSFFERLLDGLEDGKISWAELGQAALQALKDISLSKSSDGSSLAGNVFSGLGQSAWSAISSFLPKFNTGIDRVPKKMMAILDEDEAVLRPNDAEDWRAGRGSQSDAGGNVIINNYSSAKVSSTRTQRNSGGGRDFIIQLDEANAELFNDPSSRTSRAVRNAGALTSR